MRNIFKRTRPAPAAQPKVSIEDLLVLRWYGFTLDEWDALPALAKVDKRDGYFLAKGLAS